jgi:hypothetical protein
MSVAIFTLLRRRREKNGCSFKLDGSCPAILRDRLSLPESVSPARRHSAEAIAPMLNYLLGVEEAGPGDLDPEQLQRGEVNQQPWPRQSGDVRVPWTA